MNKIKNKAKPSPVTIVGLILSAFALTVVCVMVILNLAAKIMMLGPIHIYIFYIVAFVHGLVGAILSYVGSGKNPSQVNKTVSTLGVIFGVVSMVGVIILGVEPLRNFLDQITA